jgi:hypothetical protein
MEYRRYVIREGKKQQWLGWAAYLVAHEKEVFDTLKQEGCVREACWIQGEDIYYAIDSLFLGMDKDKQLNIEHMKNFKECLRFVEKYTPPIPEEATNLFDFRP